MIIDKIEYYKLYTKLSERIAKAFEFILTTDLRKLEPGNYEIDSKDVFAMVSEYDTKELTDCKLEGHTKYIDLQYMIKGVELMGYAPFSNQNPVTINEADDYTFYDGDASLTRFEEGMFTIFFPEDLHMPGVKLQQTSEVKKVVVKVRV